MNGRVFHPESQRCRTDKNGNIPSRKARLIIKRRLQEPIIPNKTHLRYPGLQMTAFSHLIFL